MNRTSDLLVVLGAVFLLTGAMLFGAVRARVDIDDGATPHRRDFVLHIEPNPFRSGLSDETLAAFSIHGTRAQKAARKFAVTRQGSLRPEDWNALSRQVGMPPDRLRTSATFLPIDPLREP